MYTLKNKKEKPFWFSSSSSGNPRDKLSSDGASPTSFVYVITIENTLAR